ncbi:Hpt domain-containing protein [Aquincola sp. S2]|uniref:Hpt domain-containing protein n=2 Tax=Pseudaquabacterium terrae TaxID=2732868 RepID=A0ABX2EK85_9BURK|nr:Hpt domain-containing protein [Aquabacterium terrae]
MNLTVIDRSVFADLQRLTGADFVADLVGTFGEEAPPLIDELRAARAAGAAERFRRAAHSLKSNANAFGAVGLAERARTLELDGLPPDVSGIDALAAELAAALAALRALASGTSGTPA